MAKREAKKVRRELSAEERGRWERAKASAVNDRETIVAQGKAVLAARKLSREVLSRLKEERERRGLSLADMMRLTGMSRESISRLENDPKPNPTMLTFARYAAALGLELRVTTGA